MKPAFSIALLAGLIALSSPTVFTQNSSPTLPSTWLGTNVSASWTPVPGATSYRVDVGTYSGGTNVVSANVGGALAAGGALGVGTYYMKVFPLAGPNVGAASNEVAFNVGTPRPGVPEGFTANLNGTTLDFAWAAPVTGGAPSAYLLQVGTAFNLTNLAPGINVGNGNTFSVPNVTTCCRRERISRDCLRQTAPAPVTLPTKRSSRSATCQGWRFRRTPPSMAAKSRCRGIRLPAVLPPTSYVIEGRYGDFRSLGVAATVGGNSTSFTAPYLPNGNYYWRVRAMNGATPGGVFGTASFVVGPTPAPPAGPRTANPRTGRRLPVPSYARSVVINMASVYRGDLLNSCREAGGNNQWMFKVLRELRRLDSRWQLNWKRGGEGDLSQDVITWNNGSLPDEGTIDVNLFDIIGGHCGGNPTWNWEDVTQKTLDGGTIGKGTLRPYVQAGYTP